MSSSEVDAIYARMGDDLEEEIPVGGHSNIRSFYAGKSIFLTGATGFVGICFVEKVLREFPDLDKLYVLVRPKKGFSPQEKIKKYFQHFVFDRLRSMNPNFEDKVVTIRGDLQEDRLGISKEDRKIITENVDIMVHNGATVKFDEIVSVSLKINVLGTKYMLDLAMECKRLQVFMYVSTAYSHCYIQDIEEKFYESPGDLAMIRDIINSDSTSKFGISEDALRMLLGKWTNIYTFTKSMAEDLVRQYGEKANFPCGVYRPTIVTAALREPLVGWIGNRNGPAAVFLGIALGLIHGYYTKNDYPMDLVPIDYSINSLISSIYDSPQRWAAEKRPIVYNFGSSTVCPADFVTMFESLLIEGENVGSMKILWHPFLYFCRTKWSFYIVHIIFHFFPALLADTALLLIGKKPRALSLFFFATKHLNKIFYFSNGNWRIHMPNMTKVLDRMTKLDKFLFPYDMTNFDWVQFTAYYTRSGRVYVIHEPLDNIVQARRHFLRMRMIHRTMKIIVHLILAYLAIRLFYILCSVVLI